MFTHPNTYVRTAALAERTHGQVPKKWTEQEAKAFAKAWNNFWAKELRKLWILIGALFLLGVIVELL